MSHLNLIALTALMASHSSNVFLLTKVDSLLPIQTPVRFDSTSPVVSSAPLGLALLVPDFLHLDLSPFPRESARPESSPSTLSACRSASTQLVLDFCKTGSPLLAKALTWSDPAPLSLGNGLGSLILLFDSLQPASFLLIQGPSQPGSPLPALASSYSDFLLLSRNSACSGLALSMPCCKADLSSLVLDVPHSGVSSLSHGNARLDAVFFALGMICLDFPLLLRHPYRVGSIMLPFASCRLGTLLSSADIGHLGSTLLPRSFGHLEMCALLLDLIGAGPTSPLHSCMKLGVVASLLNECQLDPSIFLKNIL